MIEDDVEIIVMSDKTCEGDSCGYTRPGGVAYREFHPMFKTPAPAVVQTRIPYLSHLLPAPM